MLFCFVGDDLLSILHVGLNELPFAPKGSFCSMVQIVMILVWPSGALSSFCMVLSFVASCACHAIAMQCPKMSLPLFVVANFRI
jgi:hypothetical protein